MARPRELSEELLLDIALVTFAEEGYEGASMRAICRTLEVSHNVLHKRFGSKEELWYAAVDRGFRALVEELVQATAVAGLDPFEQLRAAMLRYVAAVRARPALVQILFQESARPGPRYDHLFRNYVGPINQLGLEPLRRLQAEGVVRPGPVTTIFFHLATHGLGVMSSHPESFDLLGDGGVDHDLAAAQAVDMVLAGLRVAPR